MTHQIKYREVILDVTGNYYAGSPGTRECPPESREFEIDTVELNGVNVNELLEEKMSEIENLIIEKHYS
jgi:hypothetical protein